MKKFFLALFIISAFFTTSTKAQHRWPGEQKLKPKPVPYKTMKNPNKPNQAGNKKFENRRFKVNK